MVNGVGVGEAAGVAVGAGGTVVAPRVVAVGELPVAGTVGDRGGGVVAEAVGVAREGAVVDTGPWVEVPAGAGRDVGDGA